MKQPLVVHMAQEVLLMQTELMELRKQVAELTEYKQKYESLLASSLKHSNVMMDNTMRILMLPGVAKTLTEHGLIKEQETIK